MRGKIKSRRQLRPLLKRLQARGRRIVFTNGCFDLLHVGHIRYLEKARKMGDALVVGLNSDRSVRRIKDRGRPIIPEKERAELLAALACVDYVTVFDEPDPKRLIQGLNPDILAKGGDWPKDRIIGGDLVRARGGKVVTIPLVPHASTSHIIHRVLRRYARRARTHSA